MRCSKTLARTDTTVVVVVVAVTGPVEVSLFFCVLFDLFHARTVVLLSTVVVGWLLANEK